MITENDLSDLLGAIFTQTDLELWLRREHRAISDRLGKGLSFEELCSDAAEALVKAGYGDGNGAAKLQAALVKRVPGQSERIERAFAGAMAWPPPPGVAAALASAAVPAPVAGPAVPGRKGTARRPINPSTGTPPAPAPAGRGRSLPPAASLPAQAPLQYDVFVAHASPDKAKAKKLVDALSEAGLRAFYDGQLGAVTYNTALQDALRASRLIVFLCSRHHEAAHFFGSEMDDAVRLHRRNPTRWLIKTVGLDGFPGPTDLWPYGLGTFNPTAWPKGARISTIVDELRRCLTPAVAEVVDDLDGPGNDVAVALPPSLEEVRPRTGDRAEGSGASNPAFPAADVAQPVSDEGGRELLRTLLGDPAERLLGVVARILGCKENLDAVLTVFGSAHAGDFMQRAANLHAELWRVRDATAAEAVEAAVMRVVPYIGDWRGFINAALRDAGGGCAVSLPIRDLMLVELVVAGADQRRVRFRSEKRGTGEALVPELVVPFTGAVNAFRRADANTSALARQQFGAQILSPNELVSQRSRDLESIGKGLEPILTHYQADFTESGLERLSGRMESDLKAPIERRVTWTVTVTTDDAAGEDSLWQVVWAALKPVPEIRLIRIPTATTVKLNQRVVGVVEQNILHIIAQKGTVGR
jgi:hypothetical protein